MKTVIIVVIAACFFIVVVSGIIRIIEHIRRGEPWSAVAAGIKTGVVSVAGTILINLASSYMYDALTPVSCPSDTKTDTGITSTGPGEDGSDPSSADREDGSEPPSADREEASRESVPETDKTAETLEEQTASAERSSGNESGKKESEEKDSKAPEPSPEDITGKTSVDGTIDERGQKNLYRYTAPVSGVYRFDSDLSAGGQVCIRISGENGVSVSYGTNGLTINLEAGKTYVLGVEYRNGPCSYTVNIGTPVPVSDITGSSYVYGSIAYRDQRDEYRYTAPTEGTYRFDSDLSAGGQVCIRVSGENGVSVDYGTNGLTLDLEAGKTYILSVEYRNGPCDYAVSIGVPISVEDVSGSASVSGAITFQDQKDRYRYTASVSGTYRFDAVVDAGAQVCVRVSGENGSSLSYGTNGLTMDLEAGKTYVLGVEYRGGTSGYTVNIGAPIAVSDITGALLVSGRISYQDQKDRYRFTALTGGTYRFDAGLDAGVNVRLRISGENGSSLSYGTNGLTMDLEAGKTYILSVEYRNGFSDYGVGIGIPSEIGEITGQESVLGSITYQDQKNQYYYTAPVSGKYSFTANLSEGETVRLRVSGENGESLSYGTNSLTVDLEAGKRYILGVEYKGCLCGYEVAIGYE